MQYEYRNTLVCQLNNVVHIPDEFEDDLLKVMAQDFNRLLYSSCQNIKHQTVV